jgi:hypothetical protein
MAHTQMSKKHEAVKHSRRSYRRPGRSRRNRSRCWRERLARSIRGPRIAGGGQAEWRGTT